jgi:hypothetical protein
MPHTMLGLTYKHELAKTKYCRYDRKHGMCPPACPIAFSCYSRRTLTTWILPEPLELVSERPVMSTCMA